MRSTDRLHSKRSQKAAIREAGRDAEQLRAIPRSRLSNMTDATGCRSASRLSVR